MDLVRMFKWNTLNVLFQLLDDNINKTESKVCFF